MRGHSRRPGWAGRTAELVIGDGVGASDPVHRHDTSPAALTTAAIDRQVPDHLGRAGLEAVAQAGAVAPTAAR